MKAGQLDQTVTIYSKTQTQDASGGIVDEVASIGVWPAKVVTQKGQVALSAASTDIGRSIRVQLRFTDAITLGQFIDWSGQRYLIVEVDRSLARKGELWISATAREAT